MKIVVVIEESHGQQVGRAGRERASLLKPIQFLKPQLTAAAPVFDIQIQIEPPFQSGAKTCNPHKHDI